MTTTLEPQSVPRSSGPIRILHAALKRWGGSAVKRKVWDDEYAAGKWKAIDPQDRSPRQRDIVYGPVEFYARDKDVLDLGCGTGSTAREMENVYHSYLGVDISAVAVRRARENIRQDSAKAAKTSFIATDLASFSTDRRFGVILYRECLYYFPLARIKLLLARYGGYLRSDGVFIVRLHDRRRFRKIVSYICGAYSVVERLVPRSENSIVLVFRPRLPASNGMPAIGLSEKFVQESSR